MKKRKKWPFLTQEHETRTGEKLDFTGLIRHLLHTRQPMEKTNEKWTSSTP